jgi:chromosome partitioning protein
MIVAFLGLKGGQGKSTLTARLGCWLAAAGHRTLVIDLSPVGSCSRLLGHGSGLDEGSGSLLAATAAAEDLRRETPCPGLDLIPADSRLDDVPPGADPARFLRAAAKGYDVTLVDGPTGSGGFARTALAAAEWAVIPVTLDPLGRAGADATLQWMKEARLALRRRARLAGLLVNARRPRSTWASRGEEELRRQHQRSVFKTAIPWDQGFHGPSSLERIAARPKQPRGADKELVDFRRELLRGIVRRK